jgi:hypothetical protein
MATRLTPADANGILRHCEATDREFHRLYGWQVDYLLDQADRCGYRAPKNANGSRARYFHAYCVRLAARRAS